MLGALLFFIVKANCIFTGTQCCRVRKWRGANVSQCDGEFVLVAVDNFRSTHTFSSLARFTLIQCRTQLIYFDILMNEMFKHGLIYRIFQTMSASLNKPHPHTSSVIL